MSRDSRPADQQVTEKKQKKQVHQTDGQETESGEAGRNVLLQQHLRWPAPCGDSGLFWRQTWHGEMMRRRSRASVSAGVCRKQEVRNVSRSNGSSGNMLNLPLLCSTLFCFSPRVQYVNYETMFGFVVRKMMKKIFARPPTFAWLAILSLSTTPLS